MSYIIDPLGLRQAMADAFFGAAQRFRSTLAASSSTASTASTPGSSQAAQGFQSIPAARAPLGLPKASSSTASSSSTPGSRVQRATAVKSAPVAKKSSPPTRLERVKLEEMLLMHRYWLMKFSLKHIIYRFLSACLVTATNQYLNFGTGLRSVRGIPLRVNAIVYI